MNNQHEVTGNLLDKGELFEKENFRKRTFRLAIKEENRLSTPEFTVYGDNLSSLDSVREGDKIKVYFSLSGREWKNKEGKMLKFNDLTCYKIDVLQDEVIKGVKKGEKVEATISDVRELEEDYDNSQLPF
jgi:hypothetical protein